MLILGVYRGLAFIEDGKVVIVSHTFWSFIVDVIIVFYMLYCLRMLLSDSITSRHALSSFSTQRFTVSSPGHPLEGAFWSMNAKTFAIAGEPPRSPLAPLLRWPKGSQISVRLTNSLNVSVDRSSLAATAFSVNLHTHGLHISSDEDDPTVRVFPGESRDYKFSVLASHAGGTHWYHSHVHGLGEFHSLASAAGPLLISDDPAGREVPLAVLSAPEHVLQILRFYPGKLNKLANGYRSFLDQSPDTNPRTFVDDTEFYFEGSSDTPYDDQLSITTVNGYVFPSVDLEQGKWTRLRLIFISGDDPVEMIADGRFSFDSPPGSCQFKLIAKDGVYLEQPRSLLFEGSERIWLHPGSRADVMLRCKDMVTFRLMLHSFNARGSTTGSLPIVNMSVTPRTSSPQLLPDEFSYDACRPFYLSDLSDARVAPFPGNYTDSLRSSTERFINVEDTLDVDVSPFAMNGEGFRGFGALKNLSVMERGRVYQFRLAHGTHPLHVHVNHFQLQQDVEDGSGYHRKGDFVDTIAAPCPPQGCRNFPPRDPIETVIFRYAADRFLGRVLFHCHNYDHADSGALAEAWVVDENDAEEEDLPFEVACPASLSVREIVVTEAPSTLAPSTAAPTTDILSACTMYSNQFFLGTDYIVSSKETSARICVEVCLRIASCSFAIYGEADGHCELWSDATVSLDDLDSGEGTSLDGMYSTYACERTPVPTVPVSVVPSEAPTTSPTTQMPTGAPSIQPTTDPSVSPSEQPTGSPLVTPSEEPSRSPSVAPSPLPTLTPTVLTTSSPTEAPSEEETERPTTVAPSNGPSGSPSRTPSQMPSTGSSGGPTAFPTDSPTNTPSTSPTVSTGPTDSPSLFPTDSPTETPSTGPVADALSQGPTDAPSIFPTDSPTNTPTAGPSSSPSRSPSGLATESPSSASSSMTPSVSGSTGSPTRSVALGTGVPTGFGVRERKEGGGEDGTAVAMIAVYAMVGFLFIFVLIVSRVLWKNKKEIHTLRELTVLDESRMSGRLPGRVERERSDSAVEGEC